MAMNESVRRLERWLQWYAIAGPKLNTPPLIMNEKDGSIMVWIPPGEFEMGDGQNNNCPKHRVYLDGYYLGVHCITNRQYQRFVEATGHRPPGTSDSSYSKPIWQGRSYPAAYAEHPVVCVSWEDAQAYCAWAGLALPTEAQWERGARGPENLIYPCGNDWDADKCRHDRNRGSATTCPVFNYPQGTSVFGTLNQSGNVLEWCRDWYDKETSTGLCRVNRGGSWNFVNADYFRAARRNYYDPSCRNGNCGFRPCLPPGQ